MRYPFAIILVMPVVLSLQVAPLCRIPRQSPAARVSVLTARTWLPEENSSSSSNNSDYCNRQTRYNDGRCHRRFMASAASVEVAAGEGGLVEAELEGGGVEEIAIKQKTEKKRKKKSSTTVSKKSKAKAKGDDQDEKKASKKEEQKVPPIAGRRRISLEDVVAAEEGLHTDEYDIEEEFEGWEFVEEGEETDEVEDDKDVPFWSGAEPKMTEGGKLAGIAPEAVRIAGKAISSKYDEDTLKVETDEDFAWYLLRCFATYELRCRDAVEGFVHAWGMGDQLDRIWVPSRQVPKQMGKIVKFKEEPIYPGYLYCRVKMSQRLRDMVNDVDKIVGFVGERRDDRKKLIPDRLDPADVEGVAASERELNQGITHKILAPGDLVEILDGPFSQRKGEVSKVRDGEYVIKVNAFGRNSDVKVTWDGARKLSELEIETWFEETRRALDASYMERENRPRGRGRGRGRGRDGGRGKGLRGFTGAGLGGGMVTEEEEEAEAARRRFMERDLQAWEAESVRPSSITRRHRKRPSGDEVDAELPERAFESDKDANDFFDSLDDILGTPSSGQRRLPALPGARVQGPSMIERAHAIAGKRSKAGDNPLADGQASRGGAVKETGKMGNAGALEEGFSIVSRDSAVSGTVSDAEEKDVDDDDFFAALMQELREAPPSTPPPSSSRGGSISASTAKYGDRFSASPPAEEEKGEDDFEQVLAGLERGEALEVAAAARNKNKTKPQKDTEGIDDIFAELGLEAEHSAPRARSPSARASSANGVRTSRPSSRDAQDSRAKPRTSRDFSRDERDARVERVKRSTSRATERRIKAVDETIDTLLASDSVPDKGPRNGPRNHLGNGLSDDFVPGSPAGGARMERNEGAGLEEELSPWREFGDGSTGVPAFDDGRSSKAQARFSDMDLLLPLEARQDRPAARFEGYDSADNEDGFGDKGMETYAPPRREKPGLRPVDQRAAAKNRLEDRFQGEDRSVERSRQRSGVKQAGGRSASSAAAAAFESDGVDKDPLDAAVGAFLSEDGDSEVANPDSASPETGVSKGNQEGRDVDSAAVAPASEVLVSDDAPVESSSSNSRQGVGSSAISEIGDMKVVELKAKCKSMGLPVSGRKAELQERILKALG